MSAPGLLVGFGTADDAGVFAIPGLDERALVQSVDFFTPIVDDPHHWGRIAAANALSDIYAMGAEPLTALQLLAWPREGIPLDVAGEVLTGGADTMAEAGCVIVGGHSIDGAEPTFGFAVTGLIDVKQVVTNAGAAPGDVLVLTKPLGSGIVATAHKAGECPAGVLEETVELMAQLNRIAGSALSSHGAHAATDVTGFGLMGHLVEMLEASSAGAVIHVEAVPVIGGVVALMEAGFYPGGSRRNLASVSPQVDGDDSFLPLLADAQTSGGLLVALPPDRVSGYLHSVPGAVEVGRVTERVGIVELR